MKPELIATLLGILGYTELNSVDGMVSLSKSDVTKLQESHQEKFEAPLTIEGISYDKDDMATFQESEILAIEAALSKEAPESTTEEPTGSDAEKLKLRKDVKELADKVKILEASQKRAQETIIKLGDKPEPDLDAEDIDGLKGIAHSKTHLFASNNEWDAFEGRPWNARILNPDKKASNFYAAITIDKLNTDFGAYFRQNKTELLSFLRGKKRLPEFWNVVSNVQDQIAYAKAFTGEVTQARKKKWLPKGSFEFQPEIAKVYPIQIDQVFSGYELQSLETSWMSNLATIKNSGSTAYKMSFVAYLVSEILKKAAEEDEISNIRGVHIPTADDATVAGMAIYKSRGLLKLIKEAQARLVYKPYAVGTPTAENIVDYVDKFVMTIPEYWRDMPNMILYMSNYWVDMYLKRKKALDGVMPTYKPGDLTVERHENIQIYGLPFTNDSGFMFCTTKDNISLLENIPNEDQFIELEKTKRDINVIGDYKMGIHVWAFGYEYDTAAELSDEKQMFFSNDIPILPDVYVPVADKDTTPSVQYHTSLQTFVNTGATAITNIDDSAIGDYIYIKGNSGANPSTIANSGKFDLSANITLDENTLILLYHRGTDDFVEIKRWDLELSSVVFLAADATPADAADGNHFVCVANTGVTAFTNILNAVDGDVYKIEGSSATNSTTIAQSGYFSRITGAMTLAVDEWIQVKFNGEKFIELDRYEIA